MVKLNALNGYHAAVPIDICKAHCISIYRQPVTILSDKQSNPKVTPNI